MQRLKINKEVTETKRSPEKQIRDKKGMKDDKNELELNTLFSSKLIHN